jgi:hypothetical protein
MGLVHQFGIMFLEQIILTKKNKTHKLIFLVWQLAGD